MKKIIKSSFIIIITFAFLYSFNVRSQIKTSSEVKSGLDLNDFDNSVDPNTDFYEYSNGNWLKNNPVPPEYSSWSIWSELRNNNNEVLKKILESASNDKYASTGSNRKKLGDLYYMAMDTVTLEKEGISPLKNDLAKIDAISSREDFQKVFAYLKSFGSGGLFRLSAGQDDKNSNNVILNLFQGGTGLPEKDYYLKEDEKSKKVRSQYAEFITNIFALLGYDKNASLKNAQRIIDIETRFAKASLGRVELRNSEANYHLMTLDEVRSLTPDFSWDILFGELGLTDKSLFDNGIDVGQPEFFKELNRMLTDVSIDDWKIYLKWNLARSASNKLNSAFEDENFNFNSKVLRGTEQKDARWKRSINLVESVMGEPLGQLFAEEKFSPQTKIKALEMVENIKNAFAERLKKNEWMSETTKKEALKKLSLFTVKIGYTDKWKDYSGLQIDRNSLYENLKKAAAYNQKMNLDKIGKPVNKDEWFATPQTVNAYYSASKNEIVFPAGIMQPPFFDPDADDALNYGGIGASIGHEITHGFDDQGRKYDGEGNLKDWWTESDAKNFKERADKLVKQYSGYVATDSLHINGELTLGENIADLGGLLIAYDALQNANKGKELKPIDGFTPEQRFFLAFSGIWKSNMRPEVIRLLVNSDTHSPNKFRVIGTLSNVPYFKDAFNGKDGDPMINDITKRVVIW